MVRRILISAAVLAPALCAQSPEQRFKDAWDRYIQFDLAGDVGKEVPPDLADSMDGLGKAWAAWAATLGPSSGNLPKFTPTKAAAGSSTPSVQVLGKIDGWVLEGLSVPAPCGTHTFLALFRTKGSKWSLSMLDLHEVRTSTIPLGARENVQTLLLEGPKVAVASTPPWCISCWSAVDARVEAPSEQPESPVVLARLKDSLYRCAERPVIQLRTTKEGVEVRFQGWPGAEQVIGKKVRRLKTHRRRRP